MTYEDEIPRLLELGNVYTEREIQLFIRNARERSVVLCEDKPKFTLENTTTKYQVLSAEETYIHKDGVMPVNAHFRTKVYRIKMIV